MQDAICMDDAKEKLVNLAEHMPNMDASVYEFGRFLAGYLNPELLPVGFLLGCELALHDLHKGVNGYTKQPIGSNLAGCPSMFYIVLRMYIPTIAEAVFPPEFAAEVKSCFEEVNEKLRSER